MCLNHQSQQSHKKRYTPYKSNDKPAERMKHLVLRKSEHIRLEAGFKEWLSIMGYAETSVYSLPYHVREFLYYLEQEHLMIEDLFGSHIEAYFFLLGRRKKKRHGDGVVSVSYLHKHLQAIKRLSEYLQQTGQLSFEVAITLSKPSPQVREILSKEEIKNLYEVTTGTAMGLRDRAMLSVYYGCGLRRNEGVSLDVEDFLKDQNLLYVRKGKNYKERYVPLTLAVKADLESYLTYGRLIYEKEKSDRAMFLAKGGQRMHGQSMQVRLKALVQEAGIDKQIGLHGLRHSIATHLLSSGMKLKHIAKFLGHDSLESTQGYTHLITG
jgi:integrase/recombinase XerD